MFFHFEGSSDGSFLAVSRPIFARKYSFARCVGIYTFCTLLQLGFQFLHRSTHRMFCKRYTSVSHTELEFGVFRTEVD